MLKLICNKKVPKYFLALGGLVIVVLFALNTYPLGHWFGTQFLTFPGGPEILGIVSAAFIGVCMFIMFFHKEYLKQATHTHSKDTNDPSFKNAFQWFVIFVIGLELCSVAFRWIELTNSGNEKMGWVLLGAGLVGIGISLVFGKMLHAMMNPTPARVAANLREEAGRTAAQEGIDHLPYLNNEQKRKVANADNSPLDDVQDERAMAREREVKAVEDRRRRQQEEDEKEQRRQEEEEKRNEEMYQKMITPRSKVSSNGTSPK